MPFPPDLPGREERYPDLPNPIPGTAYLIVTYLYIMQSKGLKTQAQKRFCKPLITLPKELSELLSA
jgi:hypothetical protein